MFRDVHRAGCFHKTKDSNIRCAAQSAHADHINSTIVLFELHYFGQSVDLVWVRCQRILPLGKFRHGFHPTGFFSWLVLGMREHPHLGPFDLEQGDPSHEDVTAMAPRVSASDAPADPAAPTLLHARFRNLDSGVQLKFRDH